jgi:hypothetical protein
MSERGEILIERDFWDDPAFAHERMSEREVFLWLGAHGPVRFNAKMLAGFWGWPRGKVIPFVRKMLACGHFRMDGRSIAAVAYGNAVRHPEYIAGESWQSLRLRVFVRDGFACTYCGATTDLHCDHVFPRARGGLDVESNLTTACGPCNLSKGARTPEEWLS